jgi:iron(III) transport system ATP-binding protein
MPDKATIELRNIALAYGATEVLRDITLSVEPGEFFGLLGPSGSGKSTLLRIVAGFARPDRGELRVAGEDLSRVPPWKRNIGMVFQNYALWPHMSVAQNVAFGLEERRMPRQGIRNKVAAALELVGLADYGERHPGQLSGGQQQRVALARTIAIEPRVLLLDEPLSNLDAKLRLHMREELLALQRKLGVTTIFVTHDQEEALSICDRVAVLDAGVIQQIGTPVELYDAPTNRFVASFVGTINLLRGSIQKSVGESAYFVSSQLGELILPRIEGAPGHGPVEIAFRPHAVHLATREGDPGQVWLAGTIEEREFLGGFIRYRVRVKGTEIVADRPHFTGASPLPAGTAVHLGIEPSEIKVLGI